MAPKKTYIVSPNFDYPPGSSISLGNVLADHFSPHRSLCRLPAVEWPSLNTSSQTEISITHGASHGANISVGAQLLDIIATKIAGDVSTAGFTEYGMDTLRTEFFEADPSEDVVRELLWQNPRATRVLYHMGSAFWPQKLFMITGVKVAVGFNMSTAQQQRQSASVGADPAGVLAAAGVPVSADAEMGGFRERSHRTSLTAAGEVVLAYQLVTISPRG